MPLNNIPLELRQIPQWVVWRKELDDGDRPTKIPYNPKTAFRASSTNPEHWATFEEACAVVHHCDGLGFVLTSDCNYTCIDLDATNDPDEVTIQEHIFNTFSDTYAEISPSGAGLHIWIKATVPSGRKRKPVEIYSSARYMTFTGNVYRNAPIKEYQADAMRLWGEMAPSKEVIVSHKDEPQIHSDYQILEMASTAVNGQKLIDLFEGRWQDYYDDDPSKVSCNEADFALINIISFYSSNREQIVRIFQSSALGRRDKAKRQQYLNYMLNRAFDNQPEPIDMTALKQSLELKLKANEQTLGAIEQTSPAPTMPSESIDPPDSNESVEIPEKTVSNSKIMKVETVKEESQVSTVKQVSPVKAVKRGRFDRPPGLMGDISQFIYEASPRPVREISVAAAMGLMSGVCGRSYNVSGTGLNTYTFLLAKTGRGKEAMRKGINKLIGEACKTVPAASKFMGPAKIASPEALIKYIDKGSNCFISILGEFADTLKKMSNDSRNPQQQGVRIAMLDLYNQSGKGDALGSLIYSDKDKNTDVSAAPAFSVIGESTPEKFYELLTKDMITEGLLPRCTIIEYDGDRTEMNDSHNTAVPSRQLSEMFSALCAYSLQLNNGNNVVGIRTNDDAKKLMDSFNKQCDQYINSGGEVSAELWNRAHMKVLKLAGLLAVGCNYINPVIDMECAEWAINMIESDIKQLLTRFESGSIGTVIAQNEQSVDLKKAFSKYVTSEWKVIEKYPSSNFDMWSNRIIPLSFITCYCRARSSFKSDKISPIQAIKTCLNSMVECDEITELSAKDKREKGYASNAKLYMITNMDL